MGKAPTLRRGDDHLAYETAVTDFVNNMLLTNEQFTDMEFSANQEAVFGNNPDEEKVKVDDFEWKRISEIYPDQKLFGDSL